MPQIISRECPHRSERSEPFTMLTADIKNKHSLEQSLELYVTGEVLGGDNKYHCRSEVYGVVGVGAGGVRKSGWWLWLWGNTYNCRVFGDTY